MKRRILLFYSALFVYSALIQASVNNTGNLKNFNDECKSGSNLQQVKACDFPVIEYFRIKNIVPNDEWTVNVTFELDATNTERYRLTHDCYDYGYSYDYDIINNGSDVFTIHNVEKYLTNYFRLFAINSCGEESKATEVVLAPITTDIAPPPADTIEVKVLAGNLVITNSFDRNLSLKVYSVQGVCLLSEILMPGKNEFSMQQWSNITVIRIDDKGKTLLTKKILTCSKF